MKNTRGYTLVEMMMAIAIFAVGVSGIAAMQTLSARGNTHAKNLAMATALARSWQERLAMDGLQWGGPSNFPLANTQWLQQVDLGNNNTWFVPAQVPGLSAAADALGEPVAINAPDVVFCTHVRLTRLVRQFGSGLIRAEVRVLWLKPAWNKEGEPDGWNPGGGNQSFCQAAFVASIGARPVFNSIYKTSVVRETPGF